MRGKVGLDYTAPATGFYHRNAPLGSYNMLKRVLHVELARKMQPVRSGGALPGPSQILRRPSREKQVCRTHWARALCWK